jgi:excisionase family DNA binding protein
VPDPSPEPEDDPWLTLAEIAEELRMSPATIRSWISKGTLRAMRAGKRKWLVRRSELDRMLAGADMPGPDDSADAADWHAFDTISPPHRSPHWTGADEALGHVSPRGWLGFAESAWRDALRASAMAPPDMNFIVRRRRRARPPRWRTSATRIPARGGNASRRSPAASCPTSCARGPSGLARRSCGHGSTERSTSSAVWKVSQRQDSSITTSASLPPPAG